MKINKKMIHAAVVHAAIELSSIKDLAEKVADQIDDIEVYNTKSNGFTLRQSKGSEIDDKALTKAIRLSICDIIEDDLDNATDYINDNYDFVYNGNDIDDNHIQDLFDYSRNGRLIYVEIDM